MLFMSFLVLFVIQFKSSSQQSIDESPEPEPEPEPSVPEPDYVPEQLSTTVAPNFCDNLSIDAAVRVDNKGMIIVFKNEYFWIFDTKSRSLSLSAKISDKFKATEEINKIDSSWVQNGFDVQNPNSGLILLLKKKNIFRFSVQFTSASKFEVKYIDFNPVSKFWNISDLNKIVSAVTQLGTYEEKRQIPEISEESEDILVLHGDKYSILLWNREKMVVSSYKLNLEARSQLKSKRLDLFDPNARTDDYWRSRKYEPLKNVIEIKAFAFFPTGELFAFGEREYCNVFINGIKYDDLVCNKKSLSELFSCKIDTTSTSFSPTNQTEPKSDSMNTTQSIGVHPSSGSKGSDADQGSGSGSEDRSKNLVLYLIGGIIGLFFLILVVMAIALAVSRKESSSRLTKNKLNKSGVYEGPIDPRYGQIDSQLNLILKIRDPSVASIDVRTTPGPSASNKPNPGNGAIK